MTGDLQTRTPRSSWHPRWTRQCTLALGVLLLLAGSWPAPAPASDGGRVSDAAPTPAGPAQRMRRGGGLEERVSSLAKALDLDARQQAELRRVLVAQREETLKAWADSSVPSAVRVKATQLISERTADRIRALLNEQQRSKYNPPRDERQANAGPTRPSVEAWMSPSGTRGSAP